MSARERRMERELDREPPQSEPSVVKVVRKRAPLVVSDDMPLTAMFNLLPGDGFLVEDAVRIDELHRQYADELTQKLLVAVLRIRPKWAEGFDRIREKREWRGDLRNWRDYLGHQAAEDLKRELASFIARTKLSPDAEYASEDNWLDVERAVSRYATLWLAVADRERSERQEAARRERQDGIKNLTAKILSGEVPV